MVYRSLSYKARLIKYLLLRKISSQKHALSQNFKLVRLYARLGDYSKAVKYAEELFYEGGRKDYYFVLMNLYIMTNRYEALSDLEKQNQYTSEGDSNLIDLITNLNNNLCDIDKVTFIKNYILSKGATPSLIHVTGKGSFLKRKSYQEKELLKNSQLYIGERAQWSRNNTAPSYIKGLYSDSKNTNYNELFSYSTPIIRATKVLLSDFENTVVSVRNGLRTTVCQPEKSNRKIIFFGSSTTFSVGMSDEETLVSGVQKQINKVYTDTKVENHGVLGMNLLLAMNNLVQTDIQPNDIVVFFDFDEFTRIKDDCITKLDLNRLNRGDDFFLDLTKKQCHFSPKGNQILAETITSDILLPLLERSTRSTKAINLDNRVLDVLEKFKYFLYKQTAQALESSEMKIYLDLLNKHVPNPDLDIGSVAVNCNPITNGHLHLIEYAAKQVDKLFIFVIEEDKSFFKFEDRLKLVSESTKHIDNVTVLRGGKFICTELTYPDYFDKETTETKADASMEAWFFCEYIAKKLNISTIFLGDEPKCKITKQYNEKMQELLPIYNIDVKIIDRISTNGEVISASTVRKYLLNKEFKEIREMVPEPTYLFLRENY
ncbi:citrate lyase ligase [Photobacterium proteolyticum]|uniref:Citrate lyase ligase n=1 Tax=Photobacterium proteolyticum TaxID=1903952 RepID=A0A1Q9H182_9GAMM|nr:citrate lyase ligase [Photobacterium proteolyticum]OLQ81431.1 citrate lyase ligase [Photobacterium proteolyticum]